MAAWWQIAVLAFNLDSIVKHLVLPKEWAPKRLKAIRFGLIHVAGQVLQRARRLVVRLSESHPSHELLLMARQRMLALGSPDMSGVEGEGDPPEAGRPGRRRPKRTSRAQNPPSEGPSAVSPGLGKPKHPSSR